MNKNLDKKLLDYILEMSYKSLPFGGRKWDSSAKKLQDDLAKRGINKKLFYEYKLPGNMSHQDFQNRIALEDFVRKFYSEYSGRVMRDKSLTLSEKMKIMGFVWKMRRDKKMGNMKTWEQEIRQKNPELANVVLNVGPSALVYGALFGFAPEEIKYFTSGARDMNKEQYIDEEMQKHEIDLTYVLHPETAAKIVEALKNQKE